MSTRGANPRPKASAGQMTAAQKFLSLLPLANKPV